MASCSCRQAKHQLANTFSSVISPLRSWCVNLPASFSSGSSNSGAGLPISGDGTSRGFNPSPYHSSATSSANMISGMNRRSGDFFCISSVMFLTLGDNLNVDFSLAPGHARTAVAPVADREHAADGH